jgi:UDP-N-acetylmuramoyl-tripeptide--D-alanyl-D-alanine ligase
VIGLAGPRALSSSEIRAALELGPAAGGDAGDAERSYTGVSSDSRSVSPGELFVALRGERHDAADFLPDVARRGALGAIVAEGREDRSLGLEYFSVADPLAALGRLAGRVRRALDVQVVAVTGSSGKTTVKEMVACALGRAPRVYRTEGNLNSQVGLPLTILRAPAEADVWVLEVGASEPGEIARLAAMAAPDHVVITTVGEAHLEFFGDVAGVLDEKLDLARAGSREGVLVVGEEPPALVDGALALRPDAVVAGIGERATYRPDAYEVAGDHVRFERGGSTVRVAAGGAHHLRDALMASAVAEALGVSPDAIAAGLADYAPVGMRGALETLGDLTVLADCYNANPDSFLAAIAQCRDLFPGRRLAAFAGSMLELGEGEAASHARVARALVDAGFDVVAATGLFADADVDPGDTVWIRERSPDDAWEAFASALDGTEVVLVKASRGARLERVIDRLRGRFGGGA